MKKVLIALDYDATSQKVAENGYLLAKTLNAQIVLLHIISDLLYYTSTEYSPIVGFTGFINFNQYDTTDGLIKESYNYLNKVKLHLGDDSIQTLVKEGDFAETILNTATELKVDIIAMGTHGRKWLEKIVIGSVTEKVLNQTSIPLYIIPTKKHN